MSQLGTLENATLMSIIGTYIRDINKGEKMETLINTITIKNIIIYLIVINLIGFLAMFIDKQKAKKGAWRIPENTLFMLTLLGGGIGTIAGMYTFRHKTKKLKFTVGMPAILICELLLIVYLWYNLSNFVS